MQLNNRLLFCAIQLIITLVSNAQSEPFSKRTVVSGLNSAWEVLYGPNDSLWVTENRSYLISRINIATGAKTVLADLRATDASINFTSAAPNQPQGGLMGLAIHPNLYSSNAAVRAAKPWVYAAYVFNKGSLSLIHIYRTDYQSSGIMITAAGYGIDDSDRID